MRFLSLLLPISFLFTSSAFAGGQREIPLQLLEIDNQGRSLFIKNVLSELNITAESKVKYSNLYSIIIGGDEEGSDFKGGFFVFEVVLEYFDVQGKMQKFECYQFLTVGTLNHPTRRVSCSKISI